MEKRYKIVVLSNLKDNLNITLKSAIKLAQTVNGKIEVLYIQKPAEVVTQENQLSAVRNIHSTRVVTDKKMKRLIEPISQEYGVAINYSFVIGNLKNELVNYIDKHQPNMIILGKRKPKLFKVLGNGFTDFVLKTYKGEIMIATDKNPLEPNKDISLGTLDDMESFSNAELIAHLLKQSKAPLKSFTFVNNNQKPMEDSIPNKKTIEYVFEHTDNAIEKLPDYLSKNNINLLLVNSVKNRGFKNSNLKSSDINSIINKLNVPLVVMGEKNLV